MLLGVPGSHGVWKTGVLLGVPGPHWGPALRCWGQGWLLRPLEPCAPGGGGGTWLWLLAPLGAVGAWCQPTAGAQSTPSTLWQHL